MNGFSSSAGPLDEDHQITYPFKSFDGGVTIDKQRSGERVFDINEDGTAHYGLFPDWIEGLRQYGGDAIVNDLANGAEAYLQMWERAEGVPGPRCRSRSGDMRRTGVRHVEPGLRANKLLRQAGQPQRREGRVWRWCLNKRKLGKVAITAVLTRHGRSALVATQARGQRAGKIAVGDRRRRVTRHADQVARGLWTASAGDGITFVYGVRRGRVRFAAVATRAATKSLRRYVRLGDLW